MKINPHGYQPTIGNHKHTKSSQEPSLAPAQAQPKSAAVDLSPAARQLQQLHSDKHDIDMDRVEALRTALANGDLKIDSGRIADGIIASARELIG